MESPFAAVRAAIVPARIEPSHRSEMVTQWVCGELLEVLESRDRWLRIRGPDAYVGWIDRGGVLRLAEEPAETWREAATCRSLGTRLVRREPVGDPEWAPDHGGGPPRTLPWGARVARESDGAVRLPTGLRARPEDPDALVPEREREERFPPEAGALLATAESWEGVPYLWGGRTRNGADCSGFVQAVFALHGVRLPRDSGDQLAAGAGSGEPDPGSPDPGDLLFFGGDRQTITHVALSLGEGRILHAATGNGQVAIDDLGSDAPVVRELAAKLVGATRPLS